ncbi:hypothetical protein C9374_010874 [Naegleria lovaniensis]|uniref:Protein kinase domain-containing protein n=1 Tax=Naegleria lovaniensis TaxID=51637 RepID=A0AA88GFD4_NAELO|nr:uncharacterized protein C9374_010874 [Naegleria lovaniensis]KAG2374304.1 hypothetical protein C9374_010874 [Naegleria lovaniensis]
MSTPSNQSSPTHSLTTTTTHPHHNASSSNNINNNNNTTLVTTFLTPPSSTPSNFNISRKQHNLYTSKKALTLINNTPLIKVPYIEIYLKQASHIYERVSSSSSTTTIHSTSSNSNNSETNHNNSSISPSQQQQHSHHHHSTTNVQSSSSQSSQQQQQQHTPPPSSPNTYIVFICSIPIQTLSEFDSTNYTSSGSSNIRGYNRRVLKSNAIRMAHPVWNELFIFDIHVSNEKNLNNLQQQKHHSFGGHQTSLSSSSLQLDSSSSTSPQQQQQRIIHETILMQVWAKHIFKTDELLGTKTISLQSLVRNRENQMTLHVSGMSHAQCQIDLSIIIHDSLDSQMNVNQIGNEMGDTTTTTILTHPTLYGSGGTTLWSHSGTSASGTSGGGTMTTTSMNSPGGSSSSSTTTFDFFDPFPSSTSLLQHLIIPDHTLIQNGRYRILQYISNQASKGGDSMIYKIVDHKQNNRIKILKKIKCETIQNANDAIRESWPLSELKHSNLIPYEDMFIDITTNDVLGSIFFVCYVTPFYEEGSLYDFMVKVKKKNIYLTLRRVSDYALQIAQGMEFLHSHSIMHRNLKPSNIYLVENNTVLKIGDFGFSKSISHSATILGGVTKIANFGYTAPEIALVTEVTTVYRFEVDIWSFGIILYELLTLKIDKEQLNHCALASFQYDSYIKNVIEGEIRKIYRNDADDFIQLLKRILVLDPSQRMSAKEIVLELKTLVEKFATNSNK